MRRTRIKICGVRDVVHARIAAAAGADAVGLVFVEASPRAIAPREARAVVRGLPAFVEPVGLFMNASAEDILSVAEETGIRAVQLHGDEPPELAAQLRPLRVIKAMPFEANELAQRVDEWRSVANLSAILLDTPRASPDALPGGSGNAFDWGSLADWVRGYADALPPIVLAGGLSPESVAEAIQTVKPYAVDASSGVERERGVKDRVRIAAFCEAVQQADYSLEAASSPAAS